MAGRDVVVLYGLPDDAYTRGGSGTRATTVKGALRRPAPVSVTGGVSECSSSEPLAGAVG